MGNDPLLTCLLPPNLGRQVSRREREDPPTLRRWPSRSGPASPRSRPRPENFSGVHRS